MSIAAERAVVIRDVEKVSEIQDVEELEKQVWGITDRDVVPLTQLVAAREVGGQLIGAFDGQMLVGFAHGFVGLEQGQIVHHSHMLAVKPEYRNLNLGYKLKLAQRERVLAQGITRMTWTFDPLQSLNAHFNLHKLGVIADRYKVNFYGEETSSFLHRTGTDRLWVSWLLDSQRVRDRLEEKAITDSLPPQYEGAAPIVQLGVDGSPRLADSPTALALDYMAIEIPGDIGALEQERPGKTREWREATRQAFSEAMASGYLVEDFYRHPRNNQLLGVYFLSRGKTIEDFV